jgi:hypothetical protein
MTKIKSLKRTDFLLPKNDFFVGLGTIMNISGNYFKYNTSETAEEADKKALASDWFMVGQDIKKAKSNFEKLHKDKLCLK